ncbi:MAG: hypothetical protein LAO77_05660 [Acidobacteriia bacterium]|nr:hypothetical protein [Terriglobia bacterium]
MRIDTFTRAAAALTLLILVSPAAASEPSAARSTSVRADDAGLKELIAEGAAGSAAFRALVGAIDQSNLVVYVRCRLFPELELRGRLGLVSATGAIRFAAIEIACYQPRAAQLAILAHELQHAVEIASAPWVVDAATFERFYADTGELVRRDGLARAYETPAAVEQARRVHLELLDADKHHAGARGAAEGAALR